MRQKGDGDEGGMTINVLCTVQFIINLMRQNGNGYEGGKSINALCTVQFFINLKRQKGDDMQFFRNLIRQKGENNVGWGYMAVNALCVYSAIFKKFNETTRW